LPAATELPSKIRLDKWLWQARFFRTRSLAAKVSGGGGMRVNGQRIGKSAHMVGPGDTLTFTQANQIRVIRILAAGERRGPAPEAQLLYHDLDPPSKIAPDADTVTQAAPGSYAANKHLSPAPGFDGKGRPSKKDRRRYTLSQRTPLE
jgi:ribosome-associated heat shock protein Hsp15